MTPEQKIKHLVLVKLAERDHREPPEVTVANVDALYAEYDNIGEILEEIRQGEVETHLPVPYDRLMRYYEATPVAAKMPDGSWVGWMYWHGGGKHGVPQEIDWMDQAYDLNCVEEEKLVTVQTFTKVTPAD